MTNAEFPVLHSHETHLLICARALTHNAEDARDLVQDTYLHALEALRNAAAPPTNVRGWLVVILRNLWFSAARHHKVRRAVHAELAMQPSFDAGLHESRVMPRQFAAAWDGLPAQARSIAEQCLLDGDSHEIVSQRFGLTPGGVATSIHRTRASLRHSMFGEDAAA